MEDQNPSQKRKILKIITILAGVIVILLLLLVAVSFTDFIYYKKITEGMPQPQAIVAQKPGVTKVTLPKILYNLAGPIESLDKNSLTFKAAILQLDEANQVVQKMETRKVLISSATRFSRLTFVATEEEGRKKPQETPITFKDLKINDYIEAVSNRDISQAPEFEATQIRVLPR